ncbi:MAG: cysteine hydrolase [Lachnospiraceae bacterium]|jgi:nicotinamidase-related amidase|nr:cysteine hydrolase [Lachnospiraceae bacterium]
MTNKTEKKGKKRWLLFILAPMALIVIAVITVLVTSIRIALPTQGAPIARYSDPKAALLVIDVQNDTTDNTALYGDTTRFVEKVNEAIAIAEANDMEIIYIKNEYDGDPLVSLLAQGRYQQGTAGVELDDRLKTVNANIFSKSQGDSFATAAFEEYLIARSVDTLYIVGADAANCVYSTAMGGMNRNYAVNVISDAIITISDDAMGQVLTQYEKDGIAIKTLQELGQDE